MFGAEKHSASAMQLQLWENARPGSAPPTWTETEAEMNESQSENMKLPEMNLVFFLDSGFGRNL